MRPLSFLPSKLSGNYPLPLLPLYVFLCFVQIPTYPHVFFFCHERLHVWWRLLFFPYCRVYRASKAHWKIHLHSIVIMSYTWMSPCIPCSVTSLASCNSAEESANCLTYLAGWWRCRHNCLLEVISFVYPAELSKYNYTNMSDFKGMQNKAERSLDAVLNSTYS